MNIQVRFYTRSGNTEKLAHAVANAVGKEAKNIDSPLTEKADILFLGCSYYAFDVDEAVKKFISENKDRIGTIVCFGTSAMMKSVIKPLKKITVELGVSLSTTEFHCRGTFGPMHKGHPDKNDLEKAALFAEKVVKQYEKSTI